MHCSLPPSDSGRHLVNGRCIVVQVRFEYEFHDEAGKWFRAHGNEVCTCPLQQSALGIAAGIASVQHNTSFCCMSLSRTLLAKIICAYDTAEAITVHQVVFKGRLVPVVMSSSPLVVSSQRTYVAELGV